MEEETEEQDGGLGPVRLHQVYPALSLRGALPGPAALQGPWALGGGRAGFPRPEPEGIWVSSALQPGSLRLRLGRLELFLASSLGTPLSRTWASDGRGP